MEEKLYSISIFTEDKIGILNRITILFTRRRYNIESLTVSESEVPGVARYTITFISTKDRVEKLVKQIEKQVDVLRAFYNDDEDIVYQELALYKVSMKSISGSDSIERMIRKHNARILEIATEYMVIEKTGHKEETQALLKDLEPYGVLEFVRSGRVSVRRPMKEFKKYLHELELDSGFLNEQDK